MNKIKKLKEDQKVLATTIRKMKLQRKQVPHGYVVGLENNRQYYRYRHIAYCMLRGRSLEQIEKYPESVSMKWVNAIIEEFKEDENVCDCA